MIKIKIATGDHLSACSYYRTMGVLPYLSKIDSRIQVDTIVKGGWGDLSGYDILYMERPATGTFVTLAQIAKSMGIKVWSDFDDNFFEIPKYNPNYKWACNKDVLDAVRRCLYLSDCVTVSTPALTKYYDNNPIIIPNAMNDYIHSLPKKPSEKNIVLWRGSPTHHGDISEVLRDISSLSKKYVCDWSFVFIGNELFYIEDMISNPKMIPEMDPIKYFATIQRNEASVMISPLKDNEFNRGKSNIAWIEATMAGAACVSPNFPEFKNALTYKEPALFLHKLEDAMLDKKMRKDNFYSSRQYIVDNLLLSNVNQKRIELIYRMVAQ